jgi:5'-3' exonuclease
MKRIKSFLIRIEFDMGIFRYFYWHFKNYPDSITYLNKGESVEQFQILGIDLNAIFHPICNDYFFDKRLSVREQKTNKGCFQAICYEIESIIEMIPPTEELLLAIDGVAGLSKMNQQRQRRFRSAKEKTDYERSIFDSNHISTGTQFLYDLSTYITSYFIKKKYPFKVIMMDQSIVGEGEHKIIRYLEKKEKKRMCIFSPDADLIMLSIGLAKKNVFILRPNVYNDINCSHFIVSIDKFRKQVVHMVDPTQSFPEKEQQIVNDFVFLLFFLGNDFLPHSPSFEIKHKGIDKILEVYKSVFEKGFPLVQVTPHFAIHTMGFQLVLQALMDVELEMIIKKKRSHRGFPNKLLDKYGDRLQVDFTQYRMEYYGQHFPNVLIDTICKEYVVGLLFVGTYYYQGMPDWLYCYPYYHGCFFHELYTYSMSINTEWIYVPFEKHEPVSPLVQLVCVIPPESKACVPLCFHPYYEANSEISDMYPSEFEIDLDGVQNEYEGLVLLPPIQIDRIETAFNKVKSQLTISEQHRNCQK